ncbi:dienelactone hydrolase family protein [Nocardia bovistercoris]|uniref:Dienelactone hydrolase family protein n=1 Tax=Nocardia bovistercoris TaxID=2785916 RepID=A0A931I7I0_9NOCA|nr:dienelactone hydrolase family protein [Nocardia bovistercoris]MBH0774843.1 dienelactone hydrolase family protein [Nocardia bovistercoris]
MSNPAGAADISTIEVDGGHLAIPAGAGPFPGVVVLHDAFGLTGELRRVCDHLAANGYLAFGPRLYKRGLCVQQVFRGLLRDEGPVFDQIQRARETLTARADCTGRVGVMGFCMGGRFALVSAGRGMFDVASVNYGMLFPGKEVDHLLTDPCPVVASYGDADRYIPAADIERYRDALQRKNVPVDFRIYPNTSHSFFQNYSGPKGLFMKVAGTPYDPEVSADAWQRIFGFYEEHLRA